MGEAPSYLGSPLTSWCVVWIVSVVGFVPDCSAGLGGDRLAVIGTEPGYHEVKDTTSRQSRLVSADDGEQRDHSQSLSLAEGHAEVVTGPGTDP